MNEKATYQDLNHANLSNLLGEEFTYRTFGYDILQIGTHQFQWKFGYMSSTETYSTASDAHKAFMDYLDWLLPGQKSIYE
jgi:hypothetical protein